MTAGENQNNGSNWFSEKVQKGCEFCGAKIPALPNNGLEKAHIISQSFGPKHRWNLFVLCPTCHRVLDDVIKPRILNAIDTAASGFCRNGTTNTGEKYRILAPDHGSLFAMLVSKSNHCHPLEKIDLSCKEWPPEGSSVAAEEIEGVAT